MHLRIKVKKYCSWFAATWWVLAFVQLPLCQAVVLQSFSGIAEQITPGVVNIRTSLYIRREPGQDLYQFFLDGRIPKDTATSTSLGSGTVISEDGLIVTNYHIIEGASKIEVLFANHKEKFEAQLLGIDRKTDIALLKANANRKFTALSLGDSQALQVGDIILAVGNPFGFSHLVTCGIISAKGKVVGSGPYDDFYQTDAQINPGNSGGPLVDVRGRVIGIATALSSKSQGIGAIVPIHLVKAVVEDLKKFGKVVRPWLGIIGKNILTTDEIEHTKDPTAIYGVIIDNLIIDAPAHKAGMRIGDLIMSIDEQKVFDISDLQRVLLEKKTTENVHAKIYRREQGPLELNFSLEEIPKSQDLPDQKDLI